jgi:hypothetical protein
MKLVILLSSLFVLSGCFSMHSPYDLRDWCVPMGSPRLTSIGPQAQDPTTCAKELQEDLADPTPRILYIPRDALMTPVIAARAVWALVGRVRPPF